MVCAAVLKHLGATIPVLVIEAALIVNEIGWPEEQPLALYKIIFPV